MSSSGGNQRAFSWNLMIKYRVKWQCRKKREQSWQRVRHIRCDIPCLYFTAGLRRLGYEVARWFSVSTITTLSTSLKWHCPGEESTFSGSRSKIAEQQWENRSVSCSMNVQRLFMAIISTWLRYSACVQVHTTLSSTAACKQSIPVSKKLSELALRRWID